jgi:hypothetical protein
VAGGLVDATAAIHSSLIPVLQACSSKSLAFISPTPFHASHSLPTGKLINNFVYSPGRSVSPSTWLVARDIHHATSVCRRFYWSILNLWPHQLPRNSLIVLSGRDQLVPVQVCT